VYNATETTIKLSGFGSGLISETGIRHILSRNCFYLIIFGQLHIYVEIRFGIPSHSWKNRTKQWPLQRNCGHSRSWVMALIN